MTNQKKPLRSESERLAVVLWNLRGRPSNVSLDKVLGMWKTDFARLMKQRSISFSTLRNVLIWIFELSEDKFWVKLISNPGDLEKHLDTVLDQHQSYKIVNKPKSKTLPRYCPHVRQIPVVDCPSCVAAAGLTGTEPSVLTFIYLKGVKDGTIR